MKKLWIDILAVLCCALSAAAAFPRQNTYTDGLFSDVSAEEWYAASVKDVYELGLMNGTGGGLFAPEDNVTVAEILTMTSRARAIADGESIDTAGESAHWYDPYVAFAVSKGTVAADTYTEADFDRPATRAEVAVIFHHAMSPETYPVINTVTSIPDVFETDAYAPDVFALYRAGILTGSDEAGTFYPASPIIRAEVAAMITRVALPEKRVRKQAVTLNQEAYTLVYAPTLRGAFESVASGFLLDNRGGLPMSASGNTGDFTLNDIDETQGTALIRPFAAVTDGKVTFRARFTLSGVNPAGSAVVFDDADGGEAFRVAYDGKAFVSGGKTLYTPSENEASFVLRVLFDLDAHTVRAYFGEHDGGEAALAANSLASFRFETGEQTLAALGVGRVDLAANFAVNDDYAFDPAGALPFGYTGKNAAIAGGVLEVTDGGSAETAFAPLAGDYAASFQVKAGNGALVTLLSGDKAAVTFEAKNGSYTVNGEKIYDFAENLWYRVRLEARPSQGTLAVKLNGRPVAELPYAVSSVDSIRFAASGAVASYDDVKVFAITDPDDYVPVPVEPAGNDNYTVGVNVCSLWHNGDHYGWAPITPYEKPLLGYYDEGSPETADWEIKYMVEHGIDFQAFCWFGESANAPLKTPANSTALHEGFMNARYSDRMKYCLIWECANSVLPAGLSAWKKYFVPYLIENYFKDGRYLTVDNKPLLAVFGAGNLNGASVFGSWKGTKEAFDYLSEEVKKLGFDGMLYVSLGGSNATLALMGFEATWFYGWGRDGYRIDTNIDGNLADAAKTDLYTIPTVSVGFNDVAWWGGKRCPLISVDDYRSVNEWVRDEYLPTYAEKGSWQENFVMLSTWNEYGEGTYIAPCENNGGFGYLDVIRETYTAEKADPALDTVPTDAQKARICRLFPQDRVLLKYEDREDPAAGRELYPCLYTVKPGGFETVNSASMKSFETTDTAFVGVTDNDNRINFSNVSPVDLTAVKRLRVRVKVPAGNLMEVFFLTDTDRTWNATKSFQLRSDSDDMKEYIFETSGNPKWKGKLEALRFDPAYAADRAFSLESIEFLGEAPKSTYTVTVDGSDYTFRYPSERTANGDYLVPFDTVNVPELLDAFMTWDKEEETLTVLAGGRTLVYTVGSDIYKRDGEGKLLGFPLYTADGLPMIPLNRFCEDVGYVFREEGETVAVETARKWYYDTVRERGEAAWTFDIPGDTEKWTSAFMSMTVEDGYLHLASLNTSRDPVLHNGATLAIPAERYNKLEMRVRYKYDGEKPTRIAMFFLTDKDTAWNEDKCLRTVHNGTDSHGEWETYTIDLADFPAWKDTVTRLRFDPFDAVGEMDVDYIRFLEDPDYVWIDPKDRPFTMRNPAADDRNDVAFDSPNGKVSITSVPNHAGNCYLVTSNPGKQWLYLTQDVVFKPGKLYTVEYDICLAGKDRNPLLSETEIVYINCNMQYDDPSSKTDHVVISTPLSMASGWVHVKGECVVNAASENRGKDKFSVYSNPVADYGVAYYLDNVVVTEVTD